ncbi:MAG TPA: dienelactone hydrolase family protein [Candidatus Binataceae bacterium]|nr:dienelactone hydrolase family protein [Candidatus Binataceae bacterium]
MANEAILEREVDFPGKACTLSAYIAEPQDGPAPLPAVIVVQEWWGLNDHIRDVARRFAREGYVAVAPDLYSRQGHKVANDPNTAAELMGGLQQADGIEDLRTTAAWIRNQRRTRSSKMGIIGFCMGGSYALLLPCESKELSAAAPFYGEIPPDNKIRELSCPVFYAYDTNDGWINRSDVDRLQKALREFGKQGAVKLYPGCSHGFFNDTRADVYNAEAARDAWQQVLQLFSANLKA